MSSFDITPAVPAGRQVVQAYGGGGFRVSGINHRGSILVLPGRTLPWAPATVADITAESLSEVIDDAVSSRILLIGCGERFTPCPAPLQAVLEGGNVSLEWMDTGAACRTYNVLLLEDREVAAALIAVG